MAEKTLIAKVEKDEGDPEVLVISSPVVGISDRAPMIGQFVNPFDKISTIRILKQRYVLRLPRDVQGRVTEVFVPDGHSPVYYGAPLAKIDPRVHENTGIAAKQRTGEVGANEKDVVADLISVKSPTEGIFYRRSSPEAPAFVEVGHKVSSGTVLGLVEVMKFFNQITYGGPDLPEKGEVVQILAEDSSEVQFGQVLFQIKPFA